jgi:uncharacterized protein Smg (DUF494 family)
MQDKIVELIIFILSEIKTLEINLQDVNVVELEKLGYSKSEMNVAFSWLFDKLCFRDFGFSSSDETPHSFRVLHEVEKLAISPESYGYLIQLRELDIISDSDIEDIIEKIMMSQSHSIELDEMKDIVSSVIFDTDENISQRLSAYDNETVN